MVAHRSCVPVLHHLIFLRRKHLEALHRMELLKAAVAEENLSITVSVVIRELDLLAIAARTDKRGVAVPARV